MKCKIIEKATDMFLKHGFKSITMDDIANQMGISKKTIYKYYANKEMLVEEATELTHNKIHEVLEGIVAKDLNAVEENFAIRRMFDDLFSSADSTPLFQLKKHYPEIYEKVICKENESCDQLFRQNIEKGIAQGYYRKELDIETAVRFYYTLILNINETTALEKDSQALELLALEYHTRAIATPKGIEELEKQLQINHNN
ncbi:TetR/AcrR family transcriptional regulator [Flavobacterium amniphilum]|uniref:TetR/AcrR family transcriptional regulator n=1 Tax=Flavobacterium amniphilum TaxID=1834035 RepID=UPI00202A6CE5|nr:TetR/AcrR family transcriptional regulator [Flavobacterium amniphilum]MCL9807136.1 TetR/AcrR family transcriptional regulator [Flavobacterium amniphilum]